MAELKTQKTKASVAAFIAAIENDQRRADAKAADKMFREITGAKPAMWGESIVGYGEYAYNNTAGGGVWPMTGFAPRKANLVLYIMPGFAQYDALLKKLGKVKTGKSCLYIKKLADVDEAVLRDLIARAWAHMQKRCAA
ncbi:MAG: DUF1801 domain-containing protein [Hyphomonadaceae bacterium]